MNTKPVNRGLIVLGTIITQMGLGTIYTWSLFNQPLVDKFGWTLSSVATTFSITSFCLAFATLFAGKFQERIGLRRLTMIAGIALGAGLMASAASPSLTLIYLLMGGVVGFADGTAYITTLSNLIKWFPNRKGLIAGISVGAFGTGSLLFKYVNSFLIAEVGVSEAFFYWGIIVMAMILVGSSLLKEPAAVPVQQASVQGQTRDFSLAEMLATKESYLLFIIFFTACMSGLYLIGIVKDIGVQMAGMDMATAANAVSAIAIFNTVGRIVLGALSDNVGRMRVISFTLFVTILAVSVMTFLPLNPLLFFTCVSAIAFCFGGNITVFPAIVGDFFGLKNHSKNYGVIYQGFGIGALSGSFIAAQLGGFQATFMAIIIMSVISLLITLWVKPPKHQPVEASMRTDMAHAQS
ncbi:OFA family MFS transporter [Pectobacterium carotovorum]|uniref:L-lactate MFS transporter n=1 Tax=Pectobacterium carotovorum TaxID=554 RepID=UPI00050465DD|nr:OFA family MFS transporter [Pectobacterium carotovorum]KFW99601.1 membrane protein [Pectobacterium carotovorum subsp. carotovorum]KML69783.1 membrane protein [Pectobacterium carotovorum subsp. carotovorum ICMP 5702]MBA0191121.1 OFA family MFS transporter [Pectobacterium carotovorum]MBA0201558.1 OFA family MFS transporter [Pectobacterium carotovorum]SHG04281.1 MFS transporter, OFA family, oxalate/formate antiporter [Pectobacterium carotovorum]